MKKIIILILITLFLVSCSDSNKKYVSEDVEKCKTMKFICQVGEMPFLDEEGCGCQSIGEGEKFSSDLECADEYSPVCGIMNGADKEYNNYCFAKKDGAFDIRNGKCN